MSVGGLSETIEADLGHLKTNRTAEAFATLAEEAHTGDWSHLKVLARLLAEEPEATRIRRFRVRLFRLA